ncbi:MAG: hypothetical protein L6427_03775 [Actinomycetia bacterium]|nr:hypothetical protein [Actinomycetes bacterium]
MVRNREPSRGAGTPGEPPVVPLPVEEPPGLSPVTQCREMEEPPGLPVPLREAAPERRARPVAPP